MLGLGSRVATAVAFSAAVAGCVDDQLEPTERRPASTAGPTITEVSIEPQAINTLVARVRVTADRDVRAALSVSDGADHAWRVGPTATAGQAHELYVLGMRPETSYQVDIEVVDDAGRAARHASSHASGALPDDLPPVFVAQENTGRPDRLTALGAFRWTSGNPTADADWGYLMVIDGTGTVVWYARVDGPITEHALTAEGSFRYMGGGVYSVGLLGERTPPLLATGHPTSAQWDLPADAITVDTDTFHHDVIEAADGRLLALSTEARTLTDADCAGFGGAFDVVGDVLVEFDAASGAIENQWTFFDVLDPCAVDPAKLSTGFWTDPYGDAAVDWTHANSVVIDEERNALIVSVRQLDQVVALRYRDDASGSSGDRLWRLGAGGDFQLLGEGAEWPSRQHSAEVLSNGNLLMYDNGNQRQGVDTSDPRRFPYSRAVEYALDTSSPDPSEWTATEVWSFGKDDIRTTDNNTGEPIEIRYFAPIVGDADRTDDGTVLITHGALLEPYGLFEVAPAKKLARIVEVTHDNEKRVVFDVRLRSPTPGLGYVVYRAKRIDSLYASPALRGQ